MSACGAAGVGLEHFGVVDACLCACSWGYVHVGTHLLLDSIHNVLVIEKKRTDPFASHNLQVSTSSTLNGLMHFT